MRVAKYLESFGQKILVTIFLYFNLKKKITKKWAIYGFHHSVDITEGASAQFPKWIFNFGPYGQIRTVKISIRLEYATFEG